MPFLDGDIRVWAQLAAFVSLVLAAGIWGGGPERALSAVLAWLWGADFALHPLAGDQGIIATGHVIIDLVAATGAIAVALLANRTYPLWFAAFQLIALFAHLAHHAAPGVATLAYRLLSTGPSYFQIILLAGGIWFHRRRVARCGPYRSWRSFWPRLPARRPNSSPNA